jgi:hypothetical protein
VTTDTKIEFATAALFELVDIPDIEREEAGQSTEKRVKNRGRIRILCADATIFLGT